MRRRLLLALPLWPWAAAALPIELPPLEMPGLERRRRVRVWLPPGYERGESRHPVLYLHDGQNLADPSGTPKGSWAVEAALRTLAADGGAAPILVGIDHGGPKRLTELNPWSNPRFGTGEGEAYLRFVAETVKPLVDGRYRTRPERAHTAIGGSSLGGLVSLAALRLQPQVFGVALALSPSIWIAPELWPVMASPWPAPSRVYLHVGDQEGALHVGNLRRMHGLLAAHPEVEVTLRVVAGGRHDEPSWREELPHALRWWLR